MTFHGIAVLEMVRRHPAVYAVAHTAENDPLSTGRCEGDTWEPVGEKRVSIEGA